LNPNFLSALFNGASNF